MKHHLSHVLMCLPMIIVAAVLLLSGSGVAVLVPLAGCMLMMAVMMAAMGQSGSSGDGGQR